MSSLVDDLRSAILPYPWSNEEWFIKQGVRWKKIASKGWLTSLPSDSRLVGIRIKKGDFEAEFSVSRNLSVEQIHSCILTTVERFIGMIEIYEALADPKDASNSTESNT